MFMKCTPIETLPTDKAYLHFEATRTDGANIQVDYELVLPLQETDCRGTWDHRGRKVRPKSHRIVWLDQQNNRRIPLGRTNVGTSNQDYPFSRHPAAVGEIELPFRDGAHCGWDNKRLGELTVIYSMGGKHWILTRFPNNEVAGSSGQ